MFPSKFDGRGNKIIFYFYRPYYTTTYGIIGLFFFMNSYVMEVRTFLSKLSPELLLWQYTDEQVIQIFELVIHQLHECTDEESTLKRKILYLSKAWCLREVEICMPILLTSRFFPACRPLLVGKIFAILGRTSDFERWFPAVKEEEVYWDDDSLSLDE